MGSSERKQALTSEHKVQLCQNPEINEYKCDGGHSQDGIFKTLRPMHNRLIRFNNIYILTSYGNRVSVSSINPKKAIGRHGFTMARPDECI